MYLKRLKHLRENNELKQEDIAKILNIARQQYSLYELGKRTIYIDLLNTLANFYNTSIDYITGRINIKTPYQDNKNSILIKS